MVEKCSFLFSCFFFLFEWHDLPPGSNAITAERFGCLWKVKLYLFIPDPAQ